MRQALMQALRGLRATPTFTLIVILTLALGIGANSAIFSIVYGMMLRPFPYAQPEQLVRINTVPVKSPTNKMEVSLADFDDLARRLPSFSHLAAARTSRVNLIQDGPAIPIEITLITPGLLPTLGVNPLLGRNFTPDEDRPGGDVFKALISHALWRTRFQSNPNVLNQPLRTPSGVYTIIGVMPPDFHYPARTDVWAPVQTELAIRKQQRPPERAFRQFAVIGRLAPNATLTQAQAELRAATTDLQSQFPVANGEVSYEAQTLREAETKRLRPYLQLVLAAVGLVLLVCCANVANLFLARAAGRAKQVTIQAALGASRLRMAAALLFESAVPAILGGAAGLALAYAILRVFPSLIPEQLPLWMRFDLNPEVVAFTFAVTLFAALVAGVVPAISATRVNLVDVLKEGSRGSARGGKLRNALVVGEIALATVLLVGAGLLIQSFNKLLSVDPGFAPERVITVSVSPFRTGTNEDRIRAVCAYYQDAIRRLRELPGVIAAGATDNFPFTRQINERTTLNIEGKGDTLEAKAIRAPANFIDTTPDYFDAMGIRILEGRTYTENDDLTKPWVIMLSKRAADALFPGRSAVGQQVRAGTPGHFDPWATVVGVVANVKYRAQDDERTLEFYYPYKQYGLGTAHIALRVQGDPKALEPRIRAVLAEADPQTAVDAIKTMPTLIEDSLWQQRLWSLLLTGFAMVALLLAVVGIYGVMANFVSLRTREIGIRLAIGATPATILQSVTRHGLLLVAVGTSIGIAASLLAARFVESLLFGVRPADPLTLLGVPLILLLTGLLASLFPALRAANVDPVIALRRD